MPHDPHSQEQPYAGDSLAQALTAPDTATRRVAADALLDENEVLIGEDGVRAIVNARYTTTDPYVRDVAAELIRAMRAGAWEVYENALTLDDPIRAEAIRGLTLLQAVDELGEIALTDPDPLVRERAGNALGRLGVASAH
jgi:HEAT repeat protein